MNLDCVPPAESRPLFLAHLVPEMDKTRSMHKHFTASNAMPTCLAIALLPKTFCQTSAHQVAMGKGQFITSAKSKAHKK